MSITHAYSVAPNPKVRMTRRDTWGNQKVRPAVQKWRAFQNQVKALGITVQDGDSIVFVVEMPASWPKAKRAKMDGAPHQSKPDLDNLVGGLFDAAMPDGDQHIHELGRIRKVWGQTPAILITR